MTLPVILHSGEGESVTIGTSQCTFKLTGKDTHDHFGLFEYVLQPETEGPSPHIHKEMTEIFYVLEGEMELVLNQDKIIAPAGTLMSVPENTLHGFSNPNPQQAKFLIMFCPADSREQYFIGLAELRKNGRQPSREELLDLMQKFDQYPA
ncbi:MAG: cupin domain-containing protein [Cyanobacteria bacterium J06600_6]